MAGSLAAEADRWCIVLVVAWLAMAPVAHAAWGGANGMIVFDCGGICTVNSDGSGLRKVGVGNKPAWSPDGNRIVFERVTEEGTPSRTCTPWTPVRGRSVRAVAYWPGDAHMPPRVFSGTGDGRLISSRHERGPG